MGTLETGAVVREIVMVTSCPAAALLSKRDSKMMTTYVKKDDEAVLQSTVGSTVYQLLQELNFLF